MYKFEKNIHNASSNTEKLYTDIQVPFSNFEKSHADIPETLSDVEKLHENPTQNLPENSYRFQQPFYSQILELRQLWKDTFGDSDTFLNIFFETAFSLERCTCVTSYTYLVASLYWFDCEFFGQKIAYIYAVATAKEFRGQGICHALMKYTHEHLKMHGYAGAILSPAEESLFSFYEKMGYRTCAYTKEITCNLTEHIAADSFFLEASAEKFLCDLSSLETFTETELLLENSKCDLCLCENIESKQTLHSFKKTELTLRQISKNEFAQLRRTFLPQNAVIQENENLDFLEKQADFYAGKNFLFTALNSEMDGDESFSLEKHLHGIEFLGDESRIPDILKALGYTSASFRTIGNGKPFGMYLSFTEGGFVPSYLGFAFD